MIVFALLIVMLGAMAQGLWWLAAACAAGAFGIAFFQSVMS